MRRFFFISTVALLFLTSCNNIKKPSEGNFTNAINHYLTKHGEVCTLIGRQFPVDIPESEQKEQYGIGSQMAALERAGLVYAINTTAVVHGMLDALRGSTPPKPVKRYELTVLGKKYFRQVSGILGQANNFCYGQKTVDAIVKWTEPMTTGAYSQTEVTYTYKIVNLAGWAERMDIQRVFPDIRTTVSGTSKTNQIAELQLTNQGWEVPGQ